jgi:hypothetical protein
VRWLLIAVAVGGLVAAGCGGGGGDTTASNPPSKAGTGGITTEAGTGAGDGKTEDANTKKPGLNGSRDQESGSSGPSESGLSNGSPSGTHHDSSGGAEQFGPDEVDRSVIEFGEEADSAQFEESASVLHDFLDARSRREWAAACSYLTREVQGSLETTAERAEGEPSGCPDVLAKITNPAAMAGLRREAAAADVVSVRIEGVRAFVVYRGIGGTVLTYPLRKDGGSWRVAALGPVPIS